MIKTVNISGAETKVDNLGGYHVSIKNNGSGVIYASAKPDIAPGADGVLPIGAGECACCPDCNGTIYLKGSGEVTLGGTVGMTKLFASAGGGSGGGGGGGSSAVYGAMTSGVGTTSKTIWGEKE